METVVKTELRYYKHTHAADVTAGPELFRLRKISHEEKLEILCIILEGIDHVASVSSGDIALNLPSNEDALAALNVIENNPPTEPYTTVCQGLYVLNCLATRLVSRIHNRHRR